MALMQVMGKLQQLLAIHEGWTQIAGYYSEQGREGGREGGEKRVLEERRVSEGRDRQVNGQEGSSK